MIDTEDTEDLPGTTEVEDIITKVEITNKDKPKNPTSTDTQNPYDDMDISDEEIQSYMEDINAQ